MPRGSVMRFVPLLEACVLRERTSDPDTGFQIAIGGPLLGTTAAFAALLWGATRATGFGSPSLTPGSR